MIAQASDGWLPTDKKDLFSKRSVELICRWLDAEGSAPVIPARPWYARYNDISREYEDVLVNVLNAYAGRLPPPIIESISVVSRSELINLPKLLVQMHRMKQKELKQPPMLCLGLFDDEMETAFTQLFKLVVQLGQAEKTFKLTLRMDDKNLIAGVRSVTMGTNRLNPNDVEAFLKSQEDLKIRRRRQKDAMK